MNARHHFTGLRALTLVGAAAFALSGCMTQEEGGGDYASDGQAAFLVSEMDQMGQTLGQLSEGGLPKTAEPGDLVIRGELVIDPWDYRADCGCFVRRAEYTGHAGFERLRLDSVTVLDSAGAAMDTFRPARIAKALYRRNVTKSKDGRQVDVRIDITVDMKWDGDRRVGVWNGAMSGSFDGEEFKKFDCATCHGKDAKARKFKMPSPDIHALPTTPEDFQAMMQKKPTWPKWTKFMVEQVEPALAPLLGQHVFDPKKPEAGGLSCEACHQLKAGL